MSWRKLQRIRSFMKPARAQALPYDGARGEGGPHHGSGGEAHGEAERGLLRQQVVDAPRLGHQDRRHGEKDDLPRSHGDDRNLS